jgi:hypothetical protein
VNEKYDCFTFSIIHRDYPVGGAWPSKKENVAGTGVIFHIYVYRDGLKYSPGIGSKNSQPH